ncbi:MAG: gamma-butyrobetaine hydroxylase-like domain-containing protein [Phycisphaeraceae bacterium]
MVQSPPRPKKLDLKRDEALTVHWSDGRVSVYPIPYLRRMSPSADQRELRQEMEKNPLTVLPSGPGSGPLTATGAELVGNYAVRISFSDGHDTGIYSWKYLREIDPAGDPEEQPGGGS